MEAAAMPPTRPCRTAPLPGPAAMTPAHPAAEPPPAPTAAPPAAAGDGPGYRTADRHRAFVHDCPDGVWWFEADRPIPTDLPEDELLAALAASARLVECNAAMARLCGLDAAGEWLGARLGDLLPATDPHAAALLRAFVCS